jgi:nucleoid-associated protein YgaU
MASTPGIPQVESYDEETYFCKSGDTFETISSNYYHTAKYAQSLLLFNRNHPRAADALRQEPPLLREGQAVYIPPLRILEKNFASAIPNHSPVPPPSASPAGASPVGSSGTTGSNSPAARLYRVRRPGEMVYEIARHALGDGNRWQEIYLLNLGLNTERPVPGGSILRLPPDARIDAADAA